MTTEQRMSLAKTHYLSGCNCAQAVAAAFADVAQTDEKTLRRMASSFGGGIGQLKEVCGAVSGMALILGLLYGDFDLDNKDQKHAHYDLVQKLALEFKEKHGSLLCRDLLEKADNLPAYDESVPEPYASRPCLGLVMNAAGILDAYLKQQDK